MADSLLSKPLTLPCGIILPNRLAKAAMAEHMSDSAQRPTRPAFQSAYGAWADGGWGLVLTGNVQVDVRYLGGPYDLTMDSALPQDQLLALYKTLAQTCKRAGTPPSFASKFAFGTPREMSMQDIEDVVRRFAEAARFCADAGFDGIQIHAAHGYLLSQFLSPRANHRTDAYGGSPAGRAKIVVDIARAIREVVPPSFCVGLKLNSADHQDRSATGASSELEDCLEQTTLIAAEGLDFWKSAEELTRTLW
ncbi:unnamed protein product [Parascedosporium putredinis]|uniref:NADH:flavin oxidoreductase/NADH oxidase N-terminal domain-containing protein n=1 Tax=Parascedosporium putredinis TaxID=1442378 RepID=A0A9P1GY00_9PEZI|nr:unnamed protein product [Parascedosporium putredinis]CAI7990274.1 unnamed protein product [Parascedosporium putredinis]